MQTVELRYWLSRCPRYEYGGIGGGADGLYESRFGACLVCFGLLAGSAGGFLDTAIMNLVDIVKAFPLLLLALFVTALSGNRFELVVAAVGLAMTPDMVRFVRSNVLVVKAREYVAASQAIGCSYWRIATVHILPNLLRPMIAYITLATGRAILVEASLGFLGFGTPAPHPSLGNIMGSGMPYLRSNPWLAIAPSLFVISIVLSVNILGETLASGSPQRPIKTKLPVREEMPA